jgi:hypothetical protein
LAEKIRHYCENKKEKCHATISKGFKLSDPREMKSKLHIMPLGYYDACIEHHKLAASMYMFFYNTLTMCSKLNANEMLI